jgi:hypothetical protein
MDSMIDRAAEEDEQGIIDKINAVLPSLVQNLNSDSRLPWVHDLTREDLIVGRIPPTFATGEYFDSAIVAASMHFQDVRVHPRLIESRLSVIKTGDESKAMLADFSFYSAEDDTVGLATIEFDDTGNIVQISHPNLYREGDPYDKKSAEFTQALLTGLLLKSADDRVPASGTACEVIDGIRVYRYKKWLDTSSDYLEAPVQLAPRVMPRIRNDLVKELKNYRSPFPYVLSADNKKYFADIGTALENSTELWWVSEDMSKLAWDVTLSGTEPEDLSLTELPSPHGIMWLNGGGGPVLATKKFPDEDFLNVGDTPTELMSMNAIVWHTPTTPIPGVQIGKTRFMGMTASPDLVRDTSQWNSILSPLDLETNEIEFFRIPTYVPYENLKALAQKMALVVMRLAREEAVGEKTSEIVGVNPNKKKSRKDQKHRIETVTCASLRRQRYLSDSERETESREYSHRWIVRGHMRNQPIGPRNAKDGQKHLRVWIAPYVKGPEDKPLVLKDRVQLFVSSGRENADK